MRVIRLLGFVLLLVPALPFLAIGYVGFALGPVVGITRGVSMTASKPLNSRWIYHRTGARPDPAITPLMEALPGIWMPPLRLLMEPVLLASRLTGHRPSIARYPVEPPSTVMTMFGHRTAFLDRAFDAAIRDVEQVVILGAGWDTRAYGSNLPPGVSVYEVDAEATQSVKRAAVERAGLARPNVRFVTVDFQRQRWIDVLVEHGFDPTLPTFVLWEGVMYYLETRRPLRTRCGSWPRSVPGLASPSIT